MATQFITHVTSDGERWDLLAWRYYGDPTRLGPIIMANPGVPIMPVFGPGITVEVPILAATPSSSANLPPWKSASAQE